MNDRLQNLVDFLKEHVNATGVYIGCLQYQELEIEEDAMEEDHLNFELPEYTTRTDPAANAYPAGTSGTSVVPVSKTRVMVAGSQHTIETL